MLDGKKFITGYTERRLHKDFPQNKYETLQKRDVNADDERCQDILNMIFVQIHIQLSHNQVLILQEIYIGWMDV